MMFREFEHGHILGALGLCASHVANGCGEFVYSDIVMLEMGLVP
jgi:hypothetical protein